jgi:predicted ester cyclase
MSAEENKTRYLDYLDALLHPDQLSAVLVDGFAAHDLPPGMTLLEFRKMVMNVFPDQEFEVMHLIAEGDLVSSHLRAKGTHRGAFRGIPPTGKALTFDIFDLV